MAHDRPPDDDFEPGSGAVAHKWFPLARAEGGAFIGRHEEYRRLLDAVLERRNVWFDCPARYGVSSLIARVRGVLRFSHEPRVGSTVCRCARVHDANSLHDALLTAFGQLAAQAMRRHNVFEENVAMLFPGIETEIYLDQKNLQTIRFIVRGDSADTLLRINEQVERLSARAGCRNMLVVSDLEQVLATRDSARHLETMAALIDASRSTTWVFHGYNQHALQRAFTDSALGKHCRRFRLHPIDVGVYTKYLSDAAHARWGCYIGRKATTMMLALPRRHTYWVNTLCRALWSRDLPPLIQNVVESWDDIVAGERHHLQRELERLSTNQRAVLINLAQTPTAQPRAKSFVARTRVSSASVGQAISILHAGDLIETDLDGVWRVKDPALQWSLHPQRQRVTDIFEGNPVEL